MKDLESMLAIVQYSLQLKTIPRMGWLQRGVASAENVAAHAYSTAIIAMILLDKIEQPVDRYKVLAMVLLHDLPEAIVGDIPLPAKQLFPTDPPHLKRQIERAALQRIVDGLETEDEWIALWQESAEKQSPEAQVVADADKLELFAQALWYEQTTHNSRLAEFWRKKPDFHYAVSAEIYEALSQQRRSLS